MRMRQRAARTAALAISASLVLAGCSDDDADGGGASTETPAATDEASDPADEGSEEEAMGETITVTAVDYSYPDLPSELAAGTTVELQNDSEEEVHEILAFRLSDDEERSVEELAALPEEELGAVIADMRGVALAPPGASSTTLPTPPLTLTEPGRYVFACAIPVGAPPDEVMAAVQAFVAEGGEDPAGPAYPETGPPHFANGMIAEVTVS